ncbi:Homeodomain-like domain-containing protein [Micromonospora sp. Llam0]|uniref:helix-turn-helix domain-containing protein n=1 Tax=Micromonospora sp. Llam0 TaxID=2485143 RepID=UPI000F47EF0E|nr:helix-turn-helix domain-containing protein [Micromonospora sp. Llam0]ROO60135.1 Homeodomain-like domain-containing protein [Micromonospora sp. Llam0]
MPATPPDERPTSAQIVSRYLAGAPIRRIAAELGVSYSYVHRRLHYSGVPIRSRGGRRPDPTVHADRTPESEHSAVSADQDTLD